MRTAISSLLLVAAMSTACNQAGTGDKKDSTNVILPETAGSSCYTRITGRDSAKLQLMLVDEKADGTLEYGIYEKDKNVGVIAGTLTDNILRATYSFQSEGMQSKRDVVFKLMGEQVYEAIADSLNAEGLPVFNTNDALLKFDLVPFKKSACE